MANIRVDWPETYIARVTISNLEHRNALTYGMMRRLGEIWDELRSSQARCVVVVGDGDEAFCSGADLKQDVRTRPPNIDAMIDAAFLKTQPFNKPLIAAINGHAVAGGLELVMSADIRAVSSEARLGLPEVCRGIFPSGGGAMKLTSQIGYAAAMDLLLSGHLIGADEALRVGLVNVVLPRAEVYHWCLERARLISANSPMVVGAVKEYVAQAVTQRSESLGDLEADLVRRIRSSPDAAEGRRAFTEKRSPKWDATDAAGASVS